LIERDSPSKKSPSKNSRNALSKRNGVNNNGMITANSSGIVNIGGSNDDPYSHSNGA
jgi:hypothetical protein